VNETSPPAKPPPAGAAADGAAIGALVALFVVPTAFALSTWDLPYYFSIMRHWSVTVLVGEVVVIVCALVAGFRPHRALPAIGQLGLGAAMVWVLSTAAAAYFAQSPLAPESHFVISLIHALFALALWDRFRSRWRRWIRPMAGAAAAGAALYALVVYVIALIYGDHPDFNHERFGAGVSHVRQLGFYGLAAVGLSAGLVMTSREARERMAWLAVLTIGFALIMWSGGRGAFAAAIGAVILLVAIAPRGERARNAARFSAAFAVAIPLSLIYVPHYHWGLLRILDFLNPLDKNVDEYASSRLEMWSQAWRGFLEEPWIGHGEGEFRVRESSAQRGFNHPHNSILQFLYQWGLIGTLAIAAMLWNVVRRTLGRLGSVPADALPALGAIIGLCAMSLVEGSLYHPYPITIVLLGLASLAASLGQPASRAPA